MWWREEKRERKGEGKILEKEKIKNRVRENLISEERWSVESVRMSHLVRSGEGAGLREKRIN